MFLSAESLEKFQIPLVGMEKNLINQYITK